MKMKKVFSFLLLSLLTAASMTGCWGESTESASIPETGSGNREDEVNQEAYETEQDSSGGRSMTFGIQNYSGGGLDPAAEINCAWNLSRYGVGECLFKFDNSMNVVNTLCDTYTVNDDHTEWVFHIREGVKFSDGCDLTPEAVKASFERLFEEGPNGSSAPQVYLETDAEITADNETGNLTIRTTTPYVDLTKNLAYPVMAILDVEHTTDYDHSPIGTGPYKLVAWNRGESLEFEAFEDYFGGAAPIKQIIWKIIPEGSSRTMAMEAGEVDLVVDVETTDKTRIAETEGMTLYSEPGTSHNFLTINNEVAPFDNINFRKAIASAIDKDAVVQVALNGDGTPVNAMVPDCFEGTTDEGAPTYDVEQAKAYLEESGLDPAECGFTIICSDEIKLRSGQVIQSSLKENLGVEVQLESMDLSTYLDAVMSGNYEAALGGFTSSDR